MSEAVLFKLEIENTGRGLKAKFSNGFYTNSVNLTSVAYYEKTPWDIDGKYRTLTLWQGDYRNVFRVRMCNYEGGQAVEIGTYHTELAPYCRDLYLQRATQFINLHKQLRAFAQAAKEPGNLATLIIYTTRHTDWFASSELTIEKIAPQEIAR